MVTVLAVLTFILFIVLGSSDEKFDTTHFIYPCNLWNPEGKFDVFANRTAIIDDEGHTLDTTDHPNNKIVYQFSPQSVIFPSDNKTYLALTITA